MAHSSPLAACCKEPLCHSALKHASEQQLSHRRCRILSWIGVSFGVLLTGNV